MNSSFLLSETRDEYKTACKMSKKLTGKLKLPFSGKKINIVQWDGIVFSDKPNCGNCKKFQDELESDLKCCDRCRIAYYCGRECQVKVYPRHKKNCRTTQLTKLTEKEMLIDKPMAIFAKIVIASEEKSLHGIKIAQRELTNYLESCAHYRFILERVNFLLSLKCILYLQSDSFWASKQMFELLLCWSTKKPLEEKITFLKDDILPSCLKHDQYLFGEVPDQIREIARSDLHSQRVSKNFREICDNFWGSDWNLSQLLFGIFDQDFAESHKRWIPMYLERAPMPVLIALLSFQWKASHKYGENFVDQRSELNQVIKIISRRDQKVLELMVNPTENYMKQYPKNWDDLETDFFVMVAFPLFCSVPGSREYILGYLYPGAEIVPFSPEEKSNV